MTNAPHTPGSLGRAGTLRMLVLCEHPDRFDGDADRIDYVTLPDGSRGIYLEHHNAYVNTGLVNALNLEAGTGGTKIGYIGFSSNTTAVTATTTFLNGTSAGTAANTIIKAVATPTLSGQTMTYQPAAAFTNADFTSGVFVWNKVGLLNTATDAGTGLIDVIGGTGGTSPYNKTFTADYTSVGSFTVTPQIAVTAVAV